MPVQVNVKLVAHLRWLLKDLRRLQTKFQTPRIIFSGRSRFPVVVVGGGWLVLGVGEV